MQGQQNSTLFQSLPDEVLSKLSLCGRIANYADKQLISARGDCDRELNIVEQGLVRASTIDRDGRRSETAVLEQGDCYGEFTLLVGSPRFFDFHAQGATRIRCVSKPQFDELMQNSAGFRDGMLAMLARRLMTAVEIIEDMRRLPLPAQISKFLLLRSTAQADGIWRYHGTQIDLADTLGVSRVALGHALKTLKQAGLLNTGYGHIDICDRAGLKNWLLEHNYLHSP